MRIIFKKTITSLVCTALLFTALLSFATLLHDPMDTQDKGDCPFSVMDASLCAQSTLAAAVHHVLEYRTFLGVLVGDAVSVIFAFILLALCAALARFIRPPRVSEACFQLARRAHPPLFNSYRTKILRSLSFFEHSPSAA